MTTQLVLSHRTEHLERLVRELPAIENIIVMKGGIGKRQRQPMAVIAFRRMRGPTVPFLSGLA